MPSTRRDPRIYDIAGVVTNGKAVVSGSGTPVVGGSVTTGTTTTGSATMTAAQFTSRLHTITTTGALALTTPTAEQIVFALQPIYANTSYALTIKNPGSNTITLTGGTGVTFSGDVTIATGQIINYLVVCTTIITGSAAVTVYSLGASDTA